MADLDDLDDGGIGSVIEYDVDISEVEKPEELPAGRYAGRIKAAEVKTSNNSGSKYVDLSVFIDPSQFPATYDAENAPEGLTLHFRRLSAEKTRRAMWRMRQFCESIGVPASKEIALNEWIDKDVYVDVVHETYEGEDRAAVRNVTGA